MPNYWATSKNALAAWEVDLPHPVAGDAAPLLAFLDGVLAAGAQENVLRITPSAESGDQSYRAAVLERLEQTGKLALFAGGSWRASGRVAYFDRANRLIEEETADLGALLRRLRPELAGDHMGFMSSVPPVSIMGPRLIDTHAADGEPVPIIISLATDIWFPRVAGFLEDLLDNAPTTPAALYDNSALASRHTPRLNRFLAAVRRLTLDLGGAWTAGDWTEWDQYYGGQWNEHGIVLAAPAATS